MVALPSDVAVLCAALSSGRLCLLGGAVLSGAEGGAVVLDANPLHNADPRETPPVAVPTRCPRRV